MPLPPHAPPPAGEGLVRQFDEEEEVYLTHLESTLRKGSEEPDFVTDYCRGLNIEHFSLVNCTFVVVIDLVFGDPSISPKKVLNELSIAMPFACDYPKRTSRYLVKQEGTTISNFSRDKSSQVFLNVAGPFSAENAYHSIFFFVHLFESFVRERRLDLVVVGARYQKVNHVGVIRDGGETVLNVENYFSEMEKKTKVKYNPRQFSGGFVEGFQFKQTTFDTGNNTLTGVKDPKVLRDQLPAVISGLKRHMESGPVDNDSRIRQFNRIKNNRNYIEGRNIEMANGEASDPGPPAKAGGRKRARSPSGEGGKKKRKK